MGHASPPFFVPPGDVLGQPVPHPKANGLRPLVNAGGLPVTLSPCHLVSAPIGVAWRRAAMLARVAWATAASQAGSAGLKLAVMPRELLTTAPVPSGRKAAAVSAALPPWA